MAETQIIQVPWGDSTGDLIFLDFSNIDKGLIEVYSDTNNSSIDRVKTIEVRNMVGKSTYLKLEQRVYKELVIASFEDVVSIYPCSDSIKSGYTR